MAVNASFVIPSTHKKIYQKAELLKYANEY